MRHGPWRRLCGLPALWVGLLYDARARLDATGSTEAHFLDAIIACGQSPAAEQLRLYQTEWAADITHIYDAFAY